MVETGEPIYLDGNDDRPLMYADQLDTDSPPDREPATGLTSLTFKLAATENGAAIHASLSKSASELGTSAYYTAVFEGSDIITQLASYVGKSVCQVFGDGANINKNVWREVLPAR